MHSHYTPDLVELLTKFEVELLTPNTAQMTSHAKSSLQFSQTTQASCNLLRNG